MITGIEIENLRGIRTGKLGGLAPLTILTGPNACGKSTVLDALLIGASPDPADAVGRAVQRHTPVSPGARWLVGSAGQHSRVVLNTDQDEVWVRRIGWQDYCEEDVETELRKHRSLPPYSTLTVKEEPESAERAGYWQVGLGGDNRYEVASRSGVGLSPIPFVRLVDPGLPIPLHRTFTAVAQAGRREAVHALLEDLVPNFERLEIIALTETEFGLAVTSGGRSVPVGLSGDGIQAFIQVALEIALAPGGLALVEEPEVYQHPKAIWKTARALVANVRRGVQMVISTHSLELIDALLGEATEEDLAHIAVFNLALENGELRSGRRLGEEIRFVRMTLEADLR